MGAGDSSRCDDPIFQADELLRESDRKASAREAHSGHCFDMVGESEGRGRPVISPVEVGHHFFGGLEFM